MYDSSDPTRIPRVVDKLQRAWEGQPSLSLPALMGILANRGIGWGASDAELVAALAEMENEHPSLLDAHPGAPHTIITVAPDRLVTLSGGVVVVRSGHDPVAMPGVWAYDSLRRTGPGRPLVVRDTEGIEHRLGVVQLITRIDDADAPALAGLHHEDVGAHRWLVAFEDGARAVVGQRIRVWVKRRRDVSTRTLAWARVENCAPGEDMVVAPAGGRPQEVLGRVERVVLLETGQF
ncbi:hypothetical protein [Corynebacterium timonense]|uniref:hypothetical protein n=1 Tax=Corynebacterium timonense TaxID=441500 RepID=UPI0002DE7378|nr:hypothetical protein [Corynebacterium timonense]